VEVGVDWDIVPFVEMRVTGEGSCGEGWENVF